MTGAVLDRPRSLFEPGATARPLGRRRLTLEERLNAALQDVRADGTTECPVCGARMSFASAGARETAECGGCGASLS